MGATNSSDQKKLYYQLKQKATNQDKPHFALSGKVDGKWATVQEYDTISGRLDGLKIEEKDFGAGGKANVFVLLMEDNDGKFQIQMTHGNLTYSILNTLASLLNTLSEYTIQVYKKESKNAEGASGFFPGAYIKCDNEQIKWKVDPKQTPKGEPVMNNGKPFLQNGKPLIDYSAQKAYWEEFAQKEIIPFLSAGNKPNRPAPTSEPTPSQADNSAEVDDDLPF